MINPNKLKGHSTLIIVCSFSPPCPCVSFSIHTFLQTWVDICFNVLVGSVKQVQFIFINIYDNVFIVLLVVALCLQMLTSSFWAFYPSLFGHMFEANTLFLLVSYFVHPNSPLKTTSFLSFFICLSLYIETHHFFLTNFFHRKFLLLSIPLSSPFSKLQHLSIFLVLI